MVKTDTVTRYIAKHNPAGKPWFTIAYTGVLLIATVIQTILLHLGHLNHIFETNQEQLFMLILQAVGGIIGFIGFSLLIKGNRNFFWFTSSSNIIVGIQLILLGMWIGIAEMIIQIILLTRTYIKWGKQNDEGNKYVTSANTNDWMIIVGIYLILVIAGWLTSEYTIGTEFAPALHQNFAYYDAMLFATAMAHIYLSADKRKETQLFMLLGAVGTLILTVFQMQWSVVFITGMFTLVTAAGAASWWIKHKDHIPL